MPAKLKIRPVYRQTILLLLVTVLSLILLVSLLSMTSCLYGNDDWIPSPDNPPAKTEPFTCNATNFIKVDDIVPGYSFFVGDDRKQFFSIAKDKLVRYNTTTFQVISQRDFYQTSYSHFLPLNNNTGWLMTKPSYNQMWEVNLMDNEGRFTKNVKLENISNNSFTRKHYIVGSGDNGFIVASDDRDSAWNKFWVTRFSEAGDVLWKREFSNHGQIRAISQSADGAFLVATELITINPSAPDEVVYSVVKIDRNGNLLLSKKIRTEVYEGPRVIGIDMSLTRSGDIILMATKYSKVIVDRIDANLNVKWNKHYSNYDSDPHMLVVDSDILIYSSLGNINLTKLNGNGDVVWGRQYGGEGGEVIHAVIPLPDSGYGLLGSTHNWTGKDVVGVTKGYLIKTDSLGNTCQ